MVKTVRWRYILFEIVSGEVSNSELISLIWRQIYALFGAIEGSKTGFRLIEFDEEKKIGVARVSWLYVDHFRVALATLYMQKPDLLINELLVAGTQASLKRKFKEERLWRVIQKRSVTLDHSNQRGVDHVEGRSFRDNREGCRWEDRQNLHQAR